VYFHICFNHRRGYCCNVRTSPRVTACCYNLLWRSQDIGNTVTFLHVSLKPQHRPRTWKRTKTALPLRRSPPPSPSKTPSHRPTPLTIPNGIRIQSAVLSQYTFRTDRQTDRHTDRPTDGIDDRPTPIALTLTLTILIESDALIMRKLQTTISVLDCGAQNGQAGLETN